MWTLDYDGSMTLRLPSEELEALSSSSFYKLSLKRYAAEIADGIMRFKPALTYFRLQEDHRPVSKRGGASSDGTGRFGVVEGVYR